MEKHTFKNRFKLALFSCFFLSMTSVWGQPSYLFGDTLVDEKGLASYQLTDGTIWTFGYTTLGPHGKADIVAIHIDTAGNLLSNYLYFGSAEDDYPNNIIYENNKFILVGETHDANSVDGLVLVLDSLGNELSLDIYGQPNQTEQFFDVEATQDGGFVASGFAYVAGGTNNDFYLAKFDNKLLLEWQQVYDLGSVDIGVTVLENPQGGYLIAGDQLQPSGNFNVAVMACDPLGNYLWDSVVHNPYNGGCKSMIAVGNEVVIVGEMGTATSTFFDLYFIRMDWQGNTLFQATIPKTDQGDAAFDVYATSANDIFITGYLYKDSVQKTDMPILHIDSQANIIAEYCYGADDLDFAYDIIPNKYGGFILTGFSYVQEEQIMVVMDEFSVVNAIHQLDNQKEDYLLYPNPVHTTLMIPEELNNTTLKIVGILGEVMDVKKVDQEVHVKDLEKGFYVFAFYNSEGALIYREKIQVL